MLLWNDRLNGRSITKTGRKYLDAKCLSPLSFILFIFSAPHKQLSYFYQCICVIYPQKLIVHQDLWHKVNTQHSTMDVITNFASTNNQNQETLFHNSDYLWLGHVFVITSSFFLFDHSPMRVNQAPTVSINKSVMSILLLLNNVLNNCVPLMWRHKGHDGVSNHQPHDCLLNRLFRRRS